MPVSGGDLADPTAQCEQIGRAADAAEYGNWPQYEDSGKRPSSGTDIDAALLDPTLLDAAAQAYFSIEGNPTLARAFGLACDVFLTFRAEDLPEDARFGIMTAQAGLADSPASMPLPQPWTLTKLRTGQTNSRHFWPVTLSEYLLTRDEANGQIPPDQQHCIGQYDGLVVMGASNQKVTCSGKNPKIQTAVMPRYDLTTMDIRAALQAENQRLRAIQSDAELKSETPTGTEDAFAETIITGPDYQPLGLSLLCRSAQADAVRKLAAINAKCAIDGACVKECDDGIYVIHDAEDVTNGFRLLIGMPGGGKTGEAWDTNWRPLTARSVRYGNHRDGGQHVEAVLAKAVGRPGSDKRIALESALQALPGRELRGRDKDRVEAIVEEVVAIWDGSPGGVDCTAIRGQKSAEMEDIMPFGRVNSVPVDKSTYKVFNLRNGHPYRVAMAVAFAGGRSLAPDAIQPDPQIGSNSGDNIAIRERLFYPSATQTRQGGKAIARPYFRALRQARIGAPTVMLPEGHATRKNGPMGYEHAGKMIVRTFRKVKDEKADIRDSSRDLPKISQRLLIIPNVPQAQAARHIEKEGADRAVFDGCRKGSAPAGAHDRLVYSAATGFPAVKTRTRPGFNSEPYLYDRSVVQSTAARRAKPGEEVSNVVFKSRGWSKPTTYYPDPAADFLVVRARRMNDDGTRRHILKGSLVNIPLRSGKTYPDATTVLFSLRRSKRRIGGSDPEQSDIVTLQKNERSINPAARGDIVRSGWHLKAREVTLQLEPGDQFDIETWLVPSGWRLAHDFAVVQALAARVARPAGSALPITVSEVEIGKAVDDAGLPPEFAVDLSRALPRFRGGQSYVGPGGDILPTTGYIRAIGDALSDFMLRHPLAEISGVRTLSAIHAVNVPLQENAPSFTEISAGVEPFPDPDCEITADPAALRAVRPAEFGAAVPGYSDRQAIAEGSTLVALKGTVKLNLERIDALEIVARMVSPGADSFDDLRRGRSLAHRIADRWPTQVGGDETDFRKASSLYGFAVNPDGRVELPVAEVSLLRIDGLPYPKPGQPNELRLDEYFLETAADDAGITTRRHIFPDGKARRMLVRINGLARTAEHMETAARVLRSGDPWHGGSGIVYQSGESLPREPMRPEQMKSLSEEIEVILPATIRPATPDARAPVPVFETHQTVDMRGEDTILSFVRRARTRIPLGRGWFSSGVEERLGIVMWPPDQMLADTYSIKKNRVPLRDHDPCTPGGIGPGGFAAAMQPGAGPTSEPVIRIAKLPQFSDEDLGPGGAFVSRRGTDPVRRTGKHSDSDETQVFLSKHAFTDLWAAENSVGAAQFVPYVEMPLADKQDASTGDDGAAIQADVPPLAVALVTYQPRFDPEREEWYADVLLEAGKSADPFVRFGLVRYQPHTRSGLRCSRPVTQWAQTLPERRVELICKPDADSDPFLAQQNARDSAFMRITAFSETTSAIGVPTRDTVPLQAAGSTEGTLVRPATNTLSDTLELHAEIDHYGHGTWTAQIPMSLIHDTDRPYSLLIEEIEYFLPAEFKNEPLTLDQVKNFDAKHWTETGPRFSARIDLVDVLPMMAGD